MLPQVLIKVFTKNTGILKSGNLGLERHFEWNNSKVLFELNMLD